MNNEKEVQVELVNGTSNNYVIKDKAKILLGKFKITDLDKTNKKCNVELKFYKDNNYNLFRQSIDMILKAIFKDVNINKANFLVRDDLNFKPFLDLGFTLEGIFTDNIYSNKVYHDELSFGINRSEYQNVGRINLVYIEGKNIEIRNFTPDDAEELLEYYIANEEHLKNFEPTRDNSFFTIETQRELLGESYRQLMNGTGSDLGIYFDNKLIGKIKISNIVYGVFKSAILGYSIHKDYQGKGYMKEAVKLVCQYAKEQLDLHRLEASVLVENDRSKGVLLGCEFEEIGLNKKYLFINGKWSDHLTFYKIV